MLLTVISCALLIGADQFFKYLAVRYLAPVGAIPFIPGVLEWRYTENTGAAFNILSGYQVVLIVVTGIALLIGAFILLFKRPKDKLMLIAIIMIFSGGVGNLIDRIANGFVVDYIRVLFVNFAIFNFADCLVVVGFGLLVIAIIREELKAKKNPEGQPADGTALQAKEAGEPADAAPGASPLAESCKDDTKAGQAPARPAAELTPGRGPDVEMDTGAPPPNKADGDD